MNKSMLVHGCVKDKVADGLDHKLITRSIMSRSWPINNTLIIHCFCPTK